MVWRLKNERNKDITFDREGRIYMPDKGELRREILEEAYYSAYAMHPGSTKMYRNLKEHY